MFILQRYLFTILNKNVCDFITGLVKKLAGIKISNCFSGDVQNSYSLDINIIYRKGSNPGDLTDNLLATLVKAASLPHYDIIDMNGETRSMVFYFYVRD